MNSKTLRVLSLLICFFSNLHFAFALNEKYLTELQTKAKTLKLSQDKQWQILLHYSQNQILPGYHSLVDDAKFFLSKSGVTDAESELNETLRSFFDDKDQTEEYEPPQCHFAARYYWLNDKLQFDQEKLPEIRCNRFQEWKDALQPQGVTLVFPAAYLNNPASMFGHTLLRIDGKGQDKDSRLLAYGASYAANTEETSGFIFAINGIFGGYSGAFTIGPYYKVVKLYNDLENRDIWEYELEFTPEQIEMLIRHLWELRATNFDYYFFDENCSYHLLSLFEAANPKLNLSSKFNYWAIPSDTVKVVVEEKDFVKNIIYRPSNSTKLKRRIQNSSKEIKEAAIDVVNKKLNIEDLKLNKFSPREKAELFDLSYEYINYLRESGKDLTPESAELGFNLLKNRSTINIGNTEPNYLQYTERPESGHETGMLALSFGEEENTKYYDIQYRPAYHDILSKNVGYSDYSELKFFETSLRHYENEQIKLQNFTPLSIVSLSPRDEFFRPMSWRVGVSLDRDSIGEVDNRDLVVKFGGGSGLSYLLDKEILVYGLLLAKFQYSESYDERYAIAPASELGTILDITENLRTKLTINYSKFVIGEQFDFLKLNFENYYSLDVNNQIGINIYKEENLDSSQIAAEVILRRFF